MKLFFSKKTKRKKEYNYCDTVSYTPFTTKLLDMVFAIALVCVISFAGISVYDQLTGGIHETIVYVTECPSYMSECSPVFNSSNGD